MSGEIDFQGKLKEYTEQLQCSAKGLAVASGLSEATVSRYRGGKQRPAVDGAQFEKLVEGIVHLAKERGESGLTAEIIREELAETLEGDEGERFAEKVDLLIRTLQINVAKMSRAVSYDASFISKIRRGQRYPSDKGSFAWQLADFVANNYWDETSRKSLAELMDCGLEEIGERTKLTEMLGSWLTSASLETEKGHSYTSEFLHKLNDFDLQDFIRVIHFDDIKVPSMPFRLPASKTFRGIEGQKKAMLSFLRGVVLSKSKEPLFMCADIEIADLSADTDFYKKWMAGLAMILKKGQPFIAIHNLNRPFHEMMLGLEAYIPLYMTGLVSPYYFKGVHNAIFRHFLLVSENYALSGEAVADAYDKSRFFLTNSRDDMIYYRERAGLLLKKAYPLMDIYTMDKQEEFEGFLDNAFMEKGERHSNSSVLPIYVLPQDKLERILEKAGVEANDREILMQDAEKQRAAMEQLLENNTVIEELPLVGREEFSTHPIMLSFVETFHAPVPYSYEDYELHLKYVQEYADAHPSYRFRFCPDFAFRNIRINILRGKWVWISKAASPAIHFVIYQTQLREAIESMYMAVVD